MKYFYCCSVPPFHALPGRPEAPTTEPRGASGGAWEGALATSHLGRWSDTCRVVFRLFQVALLFTVYKAILCTYDHKHLPIWQLSAEALLPDWSVVIERFRCNAKNTNVFMTIHSSRSSFVELADVGISCATSAIRHPSPEL